MAIEAANAAALEQLRELADEQAALRRLATLAAEGAGTAPLLAAVAREVGHVLDARMVWLDRVGDGGSVETLARWPAREPGEPAAVVRVPIVVGGRRWGSLGLAPAGDPGSGEL